MSNAKDDGENKTAAKEVTEENVVRDFTPEQVAKVTSFLKERATLPCPRCSNEHFEIANFPMKLTVPRAKPKPLSPDPYYPVALSACTNCGFTSMHLVSVMGIPSSDFEPPK